MVATRSLCRVNRPALDVGDSHNSAMNLEDDMQPDEENMAEWLDRLFPQPTDNTVEWLCYCMSPYQSAIVYCMIELNAMDMDKDKQGVYQQRLQRLWKAMLESDNAEVIKQQIESARKFVRTENIL